LNATDCRKRLEDATKKEERIKNMQKSAIYENSSRRARERLEAIRHDAAAHRNRMQTKFTEIANYMANHPDMAYYLERIDPSASHALVENFLSEVKRWIVHLKPETNKIVADLLLERDNRFVRCFMCN
jgi:hypothetical protein